jgi:hypothetical protein
MAIKDWQDDWRVPVLNQEMSMDKEVDAGQEQTPAGDKMMPKKPNPGQKPCNRRKGVRQRKVPRRGRRTTPRHRRNRKKRLRQHRGPHQVLLNRTRPDQEADHTHWGCACKKSKAHKMPPEYTITEDDADLVAQMVQDRTMEDFEEAQCQRDRIQEELVDMRQLLEKIRETQRVGRGIESVPATSQAGAKAVSSEQDMIQTIAQASSNFHVTPSMLCMDEIVGQTPLKYLAQIQLVMGWIPTKALYKLQVSVAQEVQSCACTDATELQQTKDNREELELVLEQVKLETKDEKDHVDRLEQGLVVAYDRIPKSTQTTEPTTMQKIDQIVQTIDQYRQEIENLQEQLIPTTPPEVKEQRKQEATGKMEEME